MVKEASCSIVLTPTGKSFYLPGEIISGDINLTVNASINIKHMRLKIVGQIKYTVYRKETYRSPGTTTTEITNFFVQKQPLYVPITNGISVNEVSHLYFSKIYYKSKISNLF